MSVGRAGIGGTSTVCSGKEYFKSTLAGVLKAFSSCSTKLLLSEAPDSLSILISPVKSKDFFVSSSEVTSESPEGQSTWKTCAQKTGMGSDGGMVASETAGETREGDRAGTHRLEQSGNTDK